MFENSVSGSVTTPGANPFGRIGEAAAPKFTEMGTKLSANQNPLMKGFGGVFERLGNKNSPQAADTSGVPTMTPHVDNSASRQALLQAMLQRARGGQAGGAPTTPLPVPNANIPTA